MQWYAWDNGREANSRVNTVPATALRARNSFLVRHAVWRVDCQRGPLALSEESMA
jgi:hypothetical protein